MAYSEARGIPWAAVAAGLVVLSWSLLFMVSAAVTSQDAGWSGAGLVISVVLVSVIGALAGTTMLLRRNRAGAYPLALASVVSTILFIWVGIVPILGLTFAVGFLWYARRGRPRTTLPTHPVAG